MSVIPFSGTYGTYASAVGELADGEFTLGDITAPASAALDVLGWVTDPFGALAGAVLGPLLDFLANNFPPLKWPLDRLAGDQGAIAAKSQQWQDISKSLVDIGNTYAATGNDLPTWQQGGAEGGYRQTQQMIVTAFQGAANQATSVAGGVQIVGQVCAGVRDFIWGIVKGFVSSAVGNAIAAAASAIITAGGSLGAFVTWFQAKFAIVLGKISKKLADLMSYLSRVTSKWTKLSEAFRKAGDALRSFARAQNGRAGGLTNSFNTQVGAPGRPLNTPGYRPGPGQQRVGDAAKWPGRVVNGVNTGVGAGGDQPGTGTVNPLS